MYVLLRLAGTAQNNKVTTQGPKHAFRNEHNEFRGTLWKDGVEWTRSDYADRTRNTEHGYASTAEHAKDKRNAIAGRVNAVTQEKRNNAVRSQEVASRW